MPRGPRPFQRKDGRWQSSCRGKVVYGKSYAEVWAKVQALRDDAPPASLTEVVELYLLDHSARSHRVRAQRLYAWWGDRPLSDIGPGFLEDYARHLRGYRLVRDRGSPDVRLVPRGTKPGTIVGYVHFAAAVVRLAVERGWVARMPRKPTMDPAPASPKPLSDGEIYSIFGKLERSRTWRRAARVFGFMLATGCRGGEAAKLRWEWYDGHGFTIPAELHKTGRKTGQSRYIIATPAAMVEAGEPQRSGWVFESRYAEPYSSASLSTIFHKVSKSALGYGVGMHRLRHTAAMRMRDVLAPDELMKVLGHRSLMMSMRYYDRPTSVIAEKLRTLTASPRPVTDEPHRP